MKHSMVVFSFFKSSTTLYTTVHLALRMKEQQQREELNPLFDNRIALKDILPGLIIFFIVGISNIITNSLLIYIMQRIRKIGQATQLLVFHLCISDICVGLNQILCVALRVLMHNIEKTATHWLALTSFFLSYLFEPLSAALLVCIAMDRYIHLRYLTTYGTIMTKRRAKILISICIAVNVCLTAAAVLSMVNGVYDILNLILAAVYISMLTAVATFYVRAYRSVSRRVRDSSVRSMRRNGRWSRNTNRFLFRGIVLILLSLIACYSPYVFLTIGRCALHLAGKADNQITYILALAYGIKCLSATINATMLIVFNKEYRRFLVTSFSSSCGRKITVSLLASPADRSTTDKHRSQFPDPQNRTEGKQYSGRIITTAENTG